MQPLDYTTLLAVCTDLRSQWLPARLEQVYQSDRHTIHLALRTLKQRGWLTISWHPQAARVCLGDAPPRIPDTFTFSDQLRHQLNGFALTTIEAIAPWERVLDFQFAKRPGEEAIWHLYVEIMGKYSNVILTDANQQIVTVAHQVTSNQSSMRTVETGQPYIFPPALTGNAPSLQENQKHWQERVSLIPGKLKQQLLQNYRGLSPYVAEAIIQQASLNSEQSTDTLNNLDWQRLFEAWQGWLNRLETNRFSPGWTDQGYTVLGWNITKAAPSLQSLINHYYSDKLNQQNFQQLRHQLLQKLKNILSKLQQKAEGFKNRLQQATEADNYREQADLLMAYLHLWQPGMKTITLLDFTTNEPVNINLNPEKNAVQNAQALYKLHQKLKRARNAVEPLLTEVETEIAYLEQVEATITQINTYQSNEDLQALVEIRDELQQQKYLPTPRETNNQKNDLSKPHVYHTPSGFELWIGRNNQQNDRLTFRIAGDYDLWFHSQEIPGSHVLLRLEPGSVAEDVDLQFAADFAAYYSRASQSEQVPVVYTQPKNVYKPKGAKPGMVVYKQEKILWGRPQIAKEHLSQYQ